MHKYVCDSDIGSVLIGNKDWTFAVPNMGGDGTTTVEVYDSDDEFRNNYGTHHSNFISSVQGTFNLYDYDCSYHYEEKDRTVLATLEGRYGVYSNNFKVIFVKWE